MLKLFMLLVALLYIPVIAAQHTVLCSASAACEPVFCNKFDPSMDHVCRMARGLHEEELNDLSPPSVESILFALFVWVAAVCVGIAVLCACCSLVLDEDTEC